MLSQEDKNLIERTDYFVARLSPGILDDSKWLEGIRYATELKKPIYVLKEKGFHFPEHILDRADIKDIVEYRGPVDSESYKEAESRLVEIITGEKNSNAKIIDRAKKDSE